MASILWDATLIGPGGSGTATRLVGLLGAYLAAHGGEDLVLVHRTAWRPPPAWRESGLRSEVLDLPRGRVPRAALASRRLTSVAAAHRCTLLQTEQLPPPRPRGVRVLATVHDLRFLEPSLAAPAVRWLGRLGALPRLRRAWRVIAVSRTVAEQLERLARVPPERIVVVANGVKETLNAPPLVTPPGRETYLVLGHLERRKDPLTALRGFATWPGRPARARLVFVGADADRLTPRLRQEAERLGIAGAVEIHAPLADEQRDRWLASARAVILPSRLEGFGLVGLEAQAAGVPVVASAIPAHREVLGKAAIYFAPGCPRALGLCLAGLVARGGTGVAAGRANARRWSWEEAAAVLRAVHEEALGTPV